MKKPTPCTQWDAAALIGHLVQAQGNIARLVSGSEVPAGKTPLESLDAAVSAMLKAARAPGGLEKKVQGRQGEVPAAQMLGGACMDMALHTWDLAKATGQDTRLDPRVVGFIEPIVKGIASRGPSPAFAAPVQAPATAPLQDRVIALSGRRP